MDMKSNGKKPGPGVSDMEKFLDKSRQKSSKLFFSKKTSNVQDTSEMVVSMEAEVPIAELIALAKNEFPEYFEDDE